jgi:hypothetical protein
MNYIPPPLPLQSIRAAYAELGNRVRVALRTQIGDEARLNAHKAECFQMLGYVDQVRTIDRPITCLLYLIVIRCSILVLSNQMNAP